MHSKSTLSRRIPTAMAVAATALLALPASGMAAETFGSRFANSPNSGACSGLMTTPCSYVSFIHPAVGTGDPYAGGAPNDGSSDGGPYLGATPNTASATAASAA